MDAISFATNTTASEIPSQNSTNDNKDNDPNVTTSSANVDNSIANSSSQDNLASKLDDDMDDEMRLIIFDEKISNSPCSSANEDHENVSKPSETMSCGSSVKNPEGTTQANSTTTTASGHSKSPKKAQPVPETFSWPEYLQETNSEAAPPEYFFQDPTIPENKFEVGHKIELPDPRGNDVQCIATVVSVHSVWICARLDGEDASNDQWMICDDDRIRPVGDAERKGIGLQPPYGFMYSLASYHKFIENQLKPDKDGTPVIAPDECFAPISYRFHPDSNMFKVGQKCEAIDYKNFNGRPCPATVVEVIGDLITIGYDGWNQAYDTKQRFDSRHIFPMGWSEKAGLEVQPPIRIKGKVKQPILHLEATMADSGSQKNATPKATKSGASGKAESAKRKPTSTPGSGAPQARKARTSVGGKQSRSQTPSSSLASPDGRLSEAKNSRSASQSTVNSVTKFSPASSGALSLLSSPLSGVQACATGIGAQSQPQPGRSASSTSRTPSKGGGLVDEKSRVAIVNPLPDELKPAKTKETHTKRISPKSIGQNLGRAFQGASGDMMKSEKAASDSGASVSGSTEMFSKPRAKKTIKPSTSTNLTISGMQGAGAGSPGATTSLKKPLKIRAKSGSSDGVSPITSRGSTPQVSPSAMAAPDIILSIEGQSKMTVYVNRTCRCGPLLDPSKVKNLPDQFGPGRIHHVLREVVQHIVNAAAQTASVFGRLDPGTPRIISITAEINNKTYVRAIPTVKSLAAAWSYLRVYLTKLGVCPNLLTLQQTKCEICPAASSSGNNTVEGGKSDDIVYGRNISMGSARASPAGTALYHGGVSESGDSEDSEDRVIQIQDSTLLSNWSVARVAEEIESIFGTTIADKFTQNQIDGKALMLLTTELLMRHLDMPFGPALKMMSFVDGLKRNYHLHQQQSQQLQSHHRNSRTN